MPTFGSLFAGIGGIDLGLERAGWTGRWQVEYEPFCQRVLAKHWPDVPRYGDIRDVDWRTVERVGLIAGGFPCQPVSIAGRKKAQDDDRWLWPEFARAIGALRPRYVLVENVTNLMVVNGGSAFGEVIGGLAALGYDAEWDCIPAAAIGAPHLRDRVWIIGTEQPRSLADAGSGWRSDDGLRAGRDESRSRGEDRTLADDARQRRGRSRERTLDGGAGGRGTGVVGSNGHQDMADSDNPRSQGHGRLDHLGFGAREWLARASSDAFQGQWESEPDVGRVAHGVPSRVDRLRSLGNAVVPQVVEWIGRRILEAEEVAA